MSPLKSTYRIFSYFAYASMIVFIGCSATSKTLKRGEKAAERGDYYLAAQEYLSVLRDKPTHGKSIEKLSAVAEQAYEQKLKLAQGYQDQDNLEPALKEYEALRDYLGKLNRYNVLNFVPVDVDKAIADVSAGAAEKHYASAEALFKRQNYQSAIGEYKAALDFTDPYKDSNEKIAESCFQIARGKEQQNAYRLAAENYVSANEWDTNHKGCAEKAARIYFNLGDYFLSQGECRKAYTDFAAVQQIMPDFAGLPEKSAQAKKCALTKIAFMRFDNPTGKNVAGMALGDFIFDTIKSMVQKQASEFIRVLDRGELVAVIGERYIGEESLAQSGQAGKLEGVQYMVFGKINQVREQHPGLSKTRKRGTYRYWYEEEYYDKKGKKRSRTKWADANMTYAVYQNSVSLTLAGAIKVIEVKTGAVVIHHQISENRSDEVIFADDFNAPHDLSARNVELDSEIRSLAGARRQLTDVGALAKDMVDAIASSMTQKILEEIDRVPDVTDPTSLPLLLSGK